MPWRAWTSCRAQSWRNRSLDRDSSPTSWTKRGSSVSVPTDSRSRPTSRAVAWCQSGNRACSPGSRNTSRSRFRPSCRLGDSARARRLAARTSKVTASTEGGHAEDAEQLADSFRNGLAPGAAPRPAGPRRGQADQVVGGRLIKVQDPGQRLEDLDRGVPVPALLEPQVVVELIPASIATSSRRSPATRRTPVGRRPAVSGWISSRRARR